MIRHSRGQLFLTHALLSMLLGIQAYAYEFAGGSGEPDDPYQIATAPQLISIGSDPNLLGRHFILVNDVNLAAHSFTTAAIAFDTFPSHFEPPTRRTRSSVSAAAVEDGSFYGEFDGGMHRITNLRIDANAVTGQYIGLFGRVNQNGRIVNVRLEDLQITGSGDLATVGGLVGSNAGTIIGCHVSGSIDVPCPAGGVAGANTGHIRACSCDMSIAATSPVGGIAGRNSVPVPTGGGGRGGVPTAPATTDIAAGRIEECNARVALDGQSNVGGLVGSNEGQLRCSQVTGTVNAKGDAGGAVGLSSASAVIMDCRADVSVGGDERLGGLLGDNQGEVTACFANGSVTGNGFSLGGLIGINNGPVRDCYAKGNVRGSGLSKNLGGLVGLNSGLLQYCYATGRASVPLLGYRADVGGLVGTNNTSSGYIQSCFFLDFWGGGGPASHWGTELRDAEMRQRGSFTRWDFYGTAEDGTDDEWYAQEGKYPVLSWQEDITGLRRAPTVQGLSLEEANAEIERSGFTMGRVIEDHDPSVVKGECIVAIESFAPPGTAIGVIVSLGRHDWFANAGDGTMANPYVIETAYQLLSLNDTQYLWDRHFVLARDIDLLGRVIDQPLIGREVAQRPNPMAFTGSFDGNDFRIMNLVISGVGALGLFGEIGPGGEVRNLGLENAAVRSQGRALVYGSNLGLLAGFNQGAIVQCYARGSVAGAGEGGCESAGSIPLVGGLVGSNSGTIIDCWTHADVDGGGRCQPDMLQIDPPTSAAGGIAGSNGGTIRGSFADCVVRNSYDVGGLVGDNRGTAIGCYAQGTASDGFYLGGLVGDNEGTLVDCYATTNVAPGADSKNWGGLAGTSISRILQCFFLCQEDVGGRDNGYGSAVAAEDLAKRETFVGWRFCDANKADASHQWCMPEDRPPVLVWQSVTTGFRRIPDVSWLPAEQAQARIRNAGFEFVLAEDHDYHREIPEGAAMYTRPWPYARLVDTVRVVLSKGRYEWADNVGAGTPDDPYRVETPGQLEAIGDRSELLSASFILANDIDMAGRTYARPLLTPQWGQPVIGNAPTFTGTFDGAGFRIMNLSVTLLGASKGVIQNLRLTEVSLWDGVSAALASVNHGTVSHCHVTGLFTSGGEGAGLVQSNGGTITDCRMDCLMLAQGSAAGLVLDNYSLATIRACHVSGSVFAGKDAGAVTARNSGLILGCSADARVEGWGMVGGLVGVSWREWPGKTSGVVAECRSDSRVSGGECAGGLVGLNLGDVTDCYSNATVTGYASSSVGGLLGQNGYEGLGWSPRGGSPIRAQGGSVRRCYSVASVVVSEWKPDGSICRTDPDAVLIGCQEYWWSTVEASYFLDPNESAPQPAVGLGERRTASQLKQQQNFVGWDFVGENVSTTKDIWTICEGKDYPRLRWEDLPCPP